MAQWSTQEYNSLADELFGYCGRLVLGERHDAAELLEKLATSVLPAAWVEQCTAVRPAAAEVPARGEAARVRAAVALLSSTARPPAKTGAGGCTCAVCGTKELQMLKVLTLQGGLLLRHRLPEAALAGAQGGVRGGGGGDVRRGPGLRGVRFRNQRGRAQPGHPGRAPDKKAT